MPTDDNGQPDAIDTLITFVRESNQFIGLLRVLAHLPAIPYPTRWEVNEPIKRSKAAVTEWEQIQKTAKAEKWALERLHDEGQKFLEKYPFKFRTTKRSMSDSEADRRNWQINNPDLNGTIFEQQGILPFLESWFAKLDEAYAKSEGNAEVRVPLFDIAGILPRWDKTADPRGDLARVLYPTIRNPLTDVFRKFEAKQLAVESAMAAAATDSREYKSQPPGIDTSDTFTPMAFTDPETKKTYRFTRVLLWQLWKALWLGRRRFTYHELSQRVPKWKDASITDDAFTQAVKDLRRFWREQNRADLATRITVIEQTVEFEHQAVAKSS